MNIGSFCPKMAAARALTRPKRIQTIFSECHQTHWSRRWTDSRSFSFLRCFSNQVPLVNWKGSTRSIPYTSTMTLGECHNSGAPSVTKVTTMESSMSAIGKHYETFPNRRTSTLGKPWSNSTINGTRPIWWAFAFLEKVCDFLKFHCHIVFTLSISLQSHLMN